MDKKVWAIIGIITLHLALMLFFRGTLKPEELAQATKISNPDAAPIQPNPYLFPKSPAVEPIEQNNEGQTEQIIGGAERKPQQEAIVSRKQTPPTRSSEIVQTSFKTIPNRTVAVTPPVWQDTIIWIKKTEIQQVYQPVQAITVAEPKAAPAADVAPIKKKKSFMKKVVPVLRKPYDWIKTLVSKL